MRSSVALVLFRLAVAVGLAMSAALLVDYLRPVPAFCDLSGGCEAVRASALGRLGPLVPLTGVVGFAVWMATSLVSNGSRWLVRMSLVAGASGALLLLVQAFILGVFCEFCVVVDLSAIAAMVAALLHTRSQPTLASFPSEKWLWASASALSIFIPVTIGVLRPSPPVPRPIVELWKPGKLNVIELSDFQCPYCRRLHPSMNEVLREYGDRVHFVRLNVPLKSHAHARNAARAYICADAQGKAEEMADALFSSRDLSAQGAEKLAEELGLRLSSFGECVQAPATEARIEAELARVKEAGLEGLPTVWVGGEKLRGLQSVDKLRAAFARAEAATVDPSGIRAAINLLWGALAAGVAGVGIVTVRRGRSAQDVERMR